MAAIDPTKPLLFAAMPFGQKPEPGGSRIVNFDVVYRDCIQPAAAAVDVEVIRADEETLGGIIHRPMYERLLLAEIVVADLTFANANVFYELGVRHAARPRSTILIYAKVGQLPFDVAPIRAIPYELDAGGTLLDAEGLRHTLIRRFEVAMTNEVTDSPLFQLLEHYPGISLPHEVTEAFRERAVWVSRLTIEINRLGRGGGDADDPRQALVGIEAECDGATGEEQLKISLMLAYRSIEAWNDMIRLADELPDSLKRVPTVREQLALALNRRNAPGDRNRAIEIAEGLTDEYGESPETLGILGRCFKSRWQEKQAAGDVGAGDALEQAIDAYRRGFNADLRDYYPGVNLITLLVRRARPDDLVEVRRVAPVVAFAAARKGGIRSRDYWTVATVLELAAVNGSEDDGRRALSAMLDCEHDAMQLNTTADNLAIVAEALPGLGHDRRWVDELVARLREEAA
jgi:hypothetical protein